jgi:hypothetical protein
MVTNTNYDYNFDSAVIYTMIHIMAHIMIQTMIYIVFKLSNICATHFPELIISLISMLSLAGIICLNFSLKNCPYKKKNMYGTYYVYVNCSWITDIRNIWEQNAKKI